VLPSSPEHQHQGGFSLIEAIVALAIVGLALAAIAGVFSTGLRGHETAEGVDAALALAESKLAEAEAIATLRPGRSEGVFGGRYEWRLVVAPYQDEAAGPVDRIAKSLRLYRIEATAAWNDGHNRRQISLATMRLAPAPP
jgi:general secretion pathway protein I